MRSLRLNIIRKCTRLSAFTILWMLQTMRGEAREALEGMTIPVLRIKKSETSLAAIDYYQIIKEKIHETSVSKDGFSSALELASHLEGFSTQGELIILEKMAERSEEFLALQKIADSLVADSILLVSCEEKEEGEVSQCSLELFDRRRSQVIAEVSKEFRSPIRDPSLWASPMFSKLVHGIEARKLAKEREELETFLKGGERESKDSLRVGLKVSLSYEKLDLAGQNPFRILMPSLALGIRGNDVSLGVQFGYTEGQAAKSKAKVGKKSFNLYFDFDSKYQSFFSWKLGFNAGIAQTWQFTREEQAFSSKHVFAGLLTGFLFDLGQVTDLGLLLEGRQRFASFQSARTLNSKARLDFVPSLELRTFF